MNYMKGKPYIPQVNIQFFPSVSISRFPNLVNLVNPVQKFSAAFFLYFIPFMFSCQKSACI